MSKQTHVYLIPPCASQLNNNLFNKKADGSQIIWSFVKDYCGQSGIVLNTIDYWKPDNRNNDIVVVIDHPNQDSAHRIIYFIRMILFGKSFFRIKYYRLNQLLNKFSKKILFHFEPAVVTPSVYKDLPKLKQLYDQIYLTSQINGFNYFHMPQTFDAPIEPFFSNHDRKFLVMMNSNKKPLRRKNELYSERLRAIKYFSEHDNIDLYGNLWNHQIFFPYTFYKKYVKKVYRGFVDNKLATMSRYNFAICFENEISPGWITEKIFDCFLAGTIPVYLGAPNITDYVPPDCFIDFRRFKNYDALKEHLESLTSKDLQRYRENIVAYYKSGRFNVFTKNYLAKTIVAAINK